MSAQQTLPIDVTDEHDPRYTVVRPTRPTQQPTIDEIVETAGFRKCSSCGRYVLKTRWPHHLADECADDAGLREVRYEF